MKRDAQIIEWDDPRGDIGWALLSPTGDVLSKHMTSLAAEAAREHHAALRQAEARYQRASRRYEEAREARNAAVRAALANGMRPVDIARETGLTRARIAQITHLAEEA